MNIILGILWGIGGTAFFFALFFGMLKMNLSTRKNVVETMLEMFVVSGALLLVFTHLNDTCYRIFDAIYHFMRTCVGLNESNPTYLANYFGNPESGALDVGVWGAILIFVIGVFIRYMVKAQEKLLALLFFPLLILGNMIGIIGLVDKIFSTPVLLVITVAVIIFASITAFGMGEGKPRRVYPQGNHAAELSAYEDELKDRERLTNLFVTGESFTAEENQMYGGLRGDRDQELYGILQKHSREEKMRAYEEKLNERDNYY